MLNNVINSLLNLFLVSLPEEIFMVALAFILVNREDLLDVRMWKQNLKWILLPSLPMSLIVTFGKFFGLSKPLTQIIGILSLYILFTITVKFTDVIKSKIIYLKITFYIGLIFVLIAQLEDLYYPFVLSLTQTSIIYVNTNFFYNFLLALPARAIEFSLLIFLLTKRNNDVKIKLFDTILRNNFLKTSMIAIFIIIIGRTIFLIKLIGINLILIKLPFYEQIFIITLIFITPVLIITWMLLIVNYILKREKQIQQTYEKLIIQDDITTDVESNIERRDF